VSAVAVGFIVAVIASVAGVVVMQALPTRYRWSKTISVTQGESTGQLIYNARLWAPKTSCVNLPSL
jgi:hypothetical protein